MACSLALAVRGGLSLHQDISPLGGHPVPVRVRSLGFEKTKKLCSAPCTMPIQSGVSY